MVPSFIVNEYLINIGMSLRETRRERFYGTERGNVQTKPTASEAWGQWKLKINS